MRQAHCQSCYGQQTGCCFHPDTAELILKFFDKIILEHQSREKKAELLSTCLVHLAKWVRKGTENEIEKGGDQVSFTM